jgi:hypothetical protein
VKVTRANFSFDTLIAAARCVEELRVALREIDITVPGRADRRDSAHGKAQRERWTVCRLLSTLAHAEKITYPVSLHHRDRPDFALRFAESGIGVEITEAIPENFSAYCTLAAREFPDAILDIGHFRPGSPKLSANEMRALLRSNKLTSEGWSGDSVEREWAQHMSSAICKKYKSLSEADLSKFEERWLSIYDNLPLPSVHIETAISYLRASFQDVRQPALAWFDAIFIEKGRTVIQISGSGWEQLSLCDLWSPLDPIDEEFEAFHSTRTKEADEELWDELVAGIEGASR